MAHRHGSPELRVSRSDIERMERAAQILGDCRRCLGDGSVLDEIMAGAGRCDDWRHYPEGEVYDPASHAQYFYHAHPAAQQAEDEHGHFHIFLRAEGMPPGVAPLVLPEIGVADARLPPQAAPLKRGGKNEISHLVAIALDRSGRPARLFTTNRWVTGETWYPADDVARMLDRFTLAEMPPARLLNRWLSALVQLFSPQIGELLRDRDRQVTEWRQRRRGNVFEDPRLEITSTIDIDVDAQLAFLDRVRSGAPRPARHRLPRLAEGWGEDRAG